MAPTAERGDRLPRPPELPNLVLAGVSRTHAGRPVWAPVDLQLAAATLTVVTGPNGAGKTTLLRLAAGLLQPSEGSRWCSGVALYVRGGGGLRTVQTARQAVTTAASLAGRRGAAPAAIRQFGVDRYAERRVGTLSAGERVRVALAAAAVTSPTVLCLDEPTAALDAAGLDDLAALLGELRASGCSILVATHQPESLLRHADAHLQIAEGRMCLA